MARVDPNFARFRYFVEERESVRVHKAAGDLKPWTDDPILQKYKFCNIRREDDKVTQWIAKNWRTPHAPDLNLWFAMVIARFVNWPDSLVRIGYPHHGWPKVYMDGFLDVMNSPGKTWGGAYMIRSAVGSKAEYLARDVLTPMWEQRVHLRPRKQDTLSAFHYRLERCYGMGSFLAAQVVADLKYAPPLNRADDWETFAAPGPGSLRGLNRLLSFDKDTLWKNAHWHAELLRAREALNKNLKELSWKSLHAQDVQNCLCEFDKYERARLGEGRPKALYPGDR